MSWRIASALILMIVGFTAATQFLAHVFAYQAALGAPLLTIGETRIYAPWSVIAWDARWAERFTRPFGISRLITFGSVAIAALVAASALVKSRGLKPFGAAAWGGFDDCEAAGLFAAQGTVLGKFAGEILCFDGPEHQLLVGASRSGKGRGHVVPTLLTWPRSALVLDVKGELADGDPRVGFPGTAGFRETIGPVLRFAPTRGDSIAFNPLFEVRLGADEVRDVQNIVEIIVDPAGDGRHQDFWDRSAKQVIVGLILHVLYAEPPPRKNLATVREKLRNLQSTANEMRTTLHRRNPATNTPEVHPEILHAAESFLAGEERLQSGVKATAGWSIALQGMEGADPSGAAGLRDRTDFHWGRLAGAVGLSSIISVVANNAEGDQRTGSFAQTVGDAAAQEAARTGGRIVDRELSVRPTLRVRAGASVRVLVTRDIRLRPYPTQ